MSITKLVNDKKVQFNVEKVKLNKLPRHFGDADRESKEMLIDGVKTKVMINRERTQYVAFSRVEPTKDNPNFVQHYYVRDHKWFDTSAKCESVVKAAKVETPAEETVKA